ncbi:hypothetical protein LAZ67_2000116 [Cordylochernes scorpioides]|uniref:Neurotransmitter-gated ion-channel ligand-binding domain-containing protein n=1 Tax=Cordylochernes scorpioides TaxID=51811 RepID=A0ABY6K0K0_9ARAC|nr:hypothetical protein LAZ67_2000116 [Cordylochernes scorpioides]
MLIKLQDFDHLRSNLVEVSECLGIPKFLWNFALHKELFHCFRPPFYIDSLKIIIIVNIIIIDIDYKTTRWISTSDSDGTTPGWRSPLSRPLDLNDPKLVQRIWKPEVFFANAKHAEFQIVTVPNVRSGSIHLGDPLHAQITVFHIPEITIDMLCGDICRGVSRLKLTFSCMMDLYRFPLDSQVCSIELASCTHNTIPKAQLFHNTIAKAQLFHNTITKEPMNIGLMMHDELLMKIELAANLPEVLQNSEVNGNSARTAWLP